MQRTTVLQRAHQYSSALFYVQDFHPFAISSISNLFRQGDEVIEREIYENRFLETASSWSSYPIFSVTVTTESLTPLTYQCLVHHGMEGAVRVLPAGSRADALLLEQAEEARNTGSSFAALTTELEDTRSEFDKQCGTFGLEDFQLPNPFCPDRFVCGTEGVNEQLQLFARCLDAANCHMMSGMTTGVQATADAALFIHQMIPHHENAVNTAKTLLKTGSLLCPDLTDVLNPDCELEGLLLRIVAGQNHEIQLMQNFLSKRKYPQHDNCDVYVKTIDDPKELEGNEQAGIGLVSSAVEACGATNALLMAAAIWGLLAI